MELNASPGDATDGVERQVSSEAVEMVDDHDAGSGRLHPLSQPVAPSPPAAAHPVVGQELDEPPLGSSRLTVRVPDSLGRWT
jgi:hypothetical protein